MIGGVLELPELRPNAIRFDNDRQTSETLDMSWSRHLGFARRVLSLCWGVFSGPVLVEQPAAAAPCSSGRGSGSRRLNWQSTCGTAIGGRVARPVRAGISTCLVGTGSGRPSRLGSPPPQQRPVEDLAVPSGKSISRDLAESEQLLSDLMSCDSHTFCDLSDPVAGVSLPHALFSKSSASRSHDCNSLLMEFDSAAQIR